MQPVDAFRRVIAAAQGAEDGRSIDPSDPEHLKDREAISICQALMYSALPMARFECMVTVEGIGPGSKLGLGDYTACALTIAGVKNGLVGLSMEKVTVYVRLWERMQQGSEMLSGYQGDTKTLKFRNWLKDIDRWDAERPQPETQVPLVPQA